LGELRTWMGRLPGRDPTAYEPIADTRGPGLLLRKMSVGPYFGGCNSLL